MLLLIAGALWFALHKPSSDPVGPIAPASSSATFQTGQAGFDDGGGGYMWAGSGPRDRIVHVDFVKPFAEAPTVVVALSGVDAFAERQLDPPQPQCAECDTAGIRREFSTWADSKFWSAHVTWIAYKPSRAARPAAEARTRGFSPPPTRGQHPGG